MSFEANLTQGRIAESAIARWLMARGCAVVPAYEVAKGGRKGPQMFATGASFAIPDLLVFRDDTALWIEAKHKTAFSWYRRTQTWCTGVDRPHFDDYLRVQVLSGLPVWLLFLHRGGQAKDSPPSPAGLFGAPLERLATTIHHRAMMGERPMVYWGINTLKLLAALEDM